MKTYATIAPEQRMYMLNAYFCGIKPVLEPFEMRVDLTEQQRSLVAIEEGYHLVSGPAGSGKTTVLEEHIRYLIDHLLVPPDHILVLAHYNSGVDRISSNLEVYQDRAGSVSVKRLNTLGMMIFLQHRERLLRSDEQPYYTSATKLQLATKEDQRLLAEEAVEITRQEGGNRVIQEVPLAQRTYDTRLRASAHIVDRCLEGIERLRQQGIFPACMGGTEATGKVQHSQGSQSWADFVYDVYYHYLLLLAGEGKYTFDDQILFALAILKANPDVARVYQRFYEHIIVDEFQDLTKAQAELVCILSLRHRNVMAFGDAAQDIRPKKENGQQAQSALTKHFELICGNTQPMQHALQTNFRSVQEILNVAELIRGGTPQESFRGYCGEKPEVILINSAGTTQARKSLGKSTLWSMVKKALRYRKALPESDKGSVALMSARSACISEIQACLKEYGDPFVTIDRTSFHSQQIGRVLAYFHLICDKNQDDEAIQLLKNCLSYQQLRTLKENIRGADEPVIKMLLDDNFLKVMDLSPEQLRAVQQHLNIVYTYRPESQFTDVWQNIVWLPDGPLSAVTADEQQQKEFEEVRNKFRNSTVAQAIEEINSHISFLAEHRQDQQLVVTFIDHAKSQAFDTVFLIGAQELSPKRTNDRARLYVSVSRARQRFFFLIDEQADEAFKDHALLPWLRKELNNKVSWLEAGVSREVDDSGTGLPTVAWLSPL